MPGLGGDALAIFSPSRLSLQVTLSFKSTMRTIRSILPGLACSVMLVAMSTTAEVHAQAETKPEAPDPTPAPTPTPAETKPTAETETAPEAPAMNAMVNDIKKHAELCSAAQLKMDFETIVRYVPKKLLEIMGGKDVLKNRLTQGNAELKRRGVTIDSAAIGMPEVPKKHGGVLASLVPMTTHLTTPQGKLIATSHMIAISEDDGASWTFVDTATVNEEKLGVLYPPLKGKIKIPAATAQVVK